MDALVEGLVQFRVVTRDAGAGRLTTTGYSGSIVSGFTSTFVPDLFEIGDQPSTNAGLGPLGYHGGQTTVFDLKILSAARDAIPPSACGPAIDQRGFRRPFGPGATWARSSGVPAAT